MGSNLADIAAMDEAINSFFAKASAVFDGEPDAIKGIRDELRKAFEEDGAPGQIGAMATSSFLSGCMNKGLSPEDVCNTPLAYLVGSLFVEVRKLLDSIGIDSDELTMQIHSIAITQVMRWMDDVSPRQLRTNKADFWFAATFNDLTTTKWKASGN